MKLSELQAIIENTTFTEKDLVGSGARFNVWSTQEQDFVIKDFAAIRDRTLSHTLESYALASQSLGGLMPKTSYFEAELSYDDESNNSGNPHNFVQEKAVPLDEYLIALKEKGSVGIEEAKQMTRKLAETRRQIFERGVVVTSDFIYNYGVRDGRILLLDLSWVHKDFYIMFPNITDGNFMPDRKLDSTQALNKSGFVVYATRQFFAEHFGEEVAREYEQATGLEFDPNVDLSVTNTQGIENFLDELRIPASRCLWGYPNLEMPDLVDGYVRRAVARDDSDETKQFLVKIFHRYKYDSQFRAIAEQQYKRDYAKGQPVRSQPLVVN